MKFAISIDISGNPLDAAKKMRDHIVEAVQDVTLKAKKLSADVEEALDGRRAKNDYMKWCEEMWEEGNVKVTTEPNPMVPEEVYG